MVLAIASLTACGVSTGDEVTAGNGSTDTVARRSTTTQDKMRSESTDDRDTTTSTTTTEDQDTTPTAPTTTEEPDFDIQIGDQMMRDALIQGFLMVGLTQEQAECLANGYLEAGFTEPEDDIDPNTMLELFSACGVSMEDLAGLGAGNGA